MQEKLCHYLKIKGKIRLSVEGINGTVEGCQCATEVYKAELMKCGVFGNLAPEVFKSSSGTGKSFDNLIVSICSELCTIGLSPSKLKHTDGGEYLTSEQFHTTLERMQQSKKNGDRHKVRIFLKRSFQQRFWKVKYVVYFKN